MLAQRARCQAVEANTGLGNADECQSSFTCLQCNMHVTVSVYDSKTSISKYALVITRNVPNNGVSTVGEKHPGRQYFPGGIGIGNIWHHTS